MCSNLFITFKTPKLLSYYTLYYFNKIHKSMLFDAEQNCIYFLCSMQHVTTCTLISLEVHIIFPTHVTLDISNLVEISFMTNELSTPPSYTRVLNYNTAMINC
jgi:uncharacterized membrane protein